MAWLSRRRNRNTINPTGSLAIAPTSAAESAADSLTIAPGGILDLARASLRVRYAGRPDPLASIRDALAAGCHNGAWDGTTGITSAAAIPTC